MGFDAYSIDDFMTSPVDIWVSEDNVTFYKAGYVQRGTVRRRGPEREFTEHLADQVPAVLALNTNLVRQFISFGLKQLNLRVIQLFYGSDQSPGTGLRYDTTAPSLYFKIRRSARAGGDAEYVTRAWIREVGEIEEGIAAAAFLPITVEEWGTPDAANARVTFGKFQALSE